MPADGKLINFKAFHFMKKYKILFVRVSLIILSLTGFIFPAKEIPANHPYIQYFGRWSFADSLAPSHTWPGVYITARFEGTSIGMKMRDNDNYYNIFIDGQLRQIFHGASSSVASYTLASGLKDTIHTVMIFNRSESYSSNLTFNGLILDDGKNILPPPERPARRIEFIGDSFTSASGNEWTGQDTPPDINFYTNIYEGFGPITARHYEAEFQCNSRSGFGLVLDYTGNTGNNIPDYYDRAVFNSSTPKWDFSSWKPNVVVIGLGLNDYNGFGGYSGTLTQDETDLYKTRYHQFIARIRSNYSGVKILAVAAHIDWMQSTIAQVVKEENEQGRGDVFYTYYPYFTNGYVNNGHPNVESHHKIADRLIAAIDSMNAWVPYNDSIPPVFTSLPDTGITIYDAQYTLKVKTDSYSTVRYSVQDKDYDLMENTFTVTGKLEHSVTLNLQHNKKYTFYLRAVDDLGNKMKKSAMVSFSVDTTKIVSNWKSLIYDISKWKSGPAPFGLNTTAAFSTPIQPVTTAYFRKKFIVNYPDSVLGFALLTKCNEGEVVYLNGQEIDRINISKDSAVNYNTLTTQKQDVIKVTVINAQNWKKYIQPGENIIAVETHAFSAATPRLSFNSQLYDNNSEIYYPLGSDWVCYDMGNEPPIQILSKPNDVPETSSPVIPSKVHLNQNYPNPFNPATIISFGLNKREFVELKILNLLGQTVATIFKGELEAGKHAYSFDAGKFSSGVYFYQLKSPSANFVKKMLLVK
jgi:hypothetical protein